MCIRFGKLEVNFNVHMLDQLPKMKLIGSKKSNEHSLIPTSILSVLTHKWAFIFGIFEPYLTPSYLYCIFVYNLLYFVELYITPKSNFIEKPLPPQELPKNVN